MRVRGRGRLSRSIPLLLLLLIALPGCQDGEKEQGKEAAAKPTPVRVLKLVPSTITRSLRYDADVRGELELNILPLVTERIVEMKVEEGDRVRKGQVLALVRADSLSDSVRSAKAAIAAAQADRNSLGRELARQRKLLQRNVVSQAQVDQMNSRLKAAEANIARLKAMASQAKTLRQNALVRAPVRGVVGRRYLEKGDLASPSRPMFTIVQMDRVELRIEVSEGDLADIRAGMTAMVEVRRFPGRSFAGKVKRISPTIDRRTRTARVEVVVPNSKHELMPGMLARVKVLVEQRVGTIVVPYASLLVTMGADGKAEHRSFIVAGDKAVERAVKPGIMDGGRVEILKGLALAEELVTRGHHLLEPGGAVKITERVSARGKATVGEGLVPSRKGKSKGAEAP